MLLPPEPSSSSNVTISRLLCVVAQFAYADMLFCSQVSPVAIVQSCMSLHRSGTTQDNVVGTRHTVGRDGGRGGDGGRSEGDGEGGRGGGQGGRRGDKAALDGTGHALLLGEGGTNAAVDLPPRPGAQWSPRRNGR